MSNPAANAITQNAQTNNAKYVSIIPENGTEFVSGQKIIFNLDPSLGWIKGRDSYLVFDIENISAKLKLSLRNGGISAIIKQVNIFSAQNGMLLESLDNYNQWQSCEIQYRYDDPTNLTNTEGCPNSIFSKRGLQATNDNTLTYYNWTNNYAQPESSRLTQLNNDGTSQNGPVRFTCPLRCGIFRHWDTETLVPILQMGGLRIELVMADPLEVMDMPYTGNPVSNGGHLSGDAMGLLINVDNFADTATTLVLTEPMSITASGLIVGQEIKVSYNANTTILDKTITALALDAATGKVQITVAAMTPANTFGDGNMKLNPTTMFIPQNIAYRIRNAEFRLLQEMPPDTKMKTVDYVFTSYDLFRDSVPQSQTSFNQDVTSVASKAVSLFTMYEDPQYDGIVNFPQQSYYQGLAPSELGVNLNSVVYFINNKLYPLRPYNPQRFNDKVINQNEVVKAFGTLNIAVKSLGSGEHSSLDCYTNRYLHARELARGNSVFNLQNAEPQIRIGFSGPRGNDKFAKQIGNIKMNTYVFSKKILHIDGETGLSLEH
tara:strand:- start:3177 stop:4814 length:1638 start_codon:yes stop_codon:yes gene_type:complete